MVCEDCKSDESVVGSPNSAAALAALKFKYGDIGSETFKLESHRSVAIRTREAGSSDEEGGVAE